MVGLLFERRVGGAGRSLGMGASGPHGAGLEPRLEALHPAARKPRWRECLGGRAGGELPGAEWEWDCAPGGLGGWPGSRCARRAVFLALLGLERHRSRVMAEVSGTPAGGARAARSIRARGAGARSLRDRLLGGGVDGRRGPGRSLRGLGVLGTGGRRPRGRRWGGRTRPGRRGSRRLGGSGRRLGLSGRRWPGRGRAGLWNGGAGRTLGVGPGPGTWALVGQVWPWADQRVAARERALRTRSRTTAVGSGGAASALAMTVVARIRTRRSTRSSSGPERRAW